MDGSHECGGSVVQSTFIEAVFSGVVPGDSKSVTDHHITMPMAEKKHTSFLSVQGTFFF